MTFHFYSLHLNPSKNCDPRKTVTDRESLWLYVNNASDSVRFFLLCHFSSVKSQWVQMPSLQLRKTVINEASECCTDSLGKLHAGDNSREHFQTISMVKWEYIRKRKNNWKAGSKSKCKYMSFDSKVCAKGKNVWVLLCKNLQRKMNFSFKIASMLFVRHFT